jgi:hypothetical protein
MSASKRQLQELYGDNWGFRLDGSFQFGNNVIQKPTLDLFAKCTVCKDTRLIHQKEKTKRGRWRTKLVNCPHC